MIGSYSITPMRQIHINKVVDVHLASFPNFFLSFLGKAFLKVLYSSILEDPSHIAFVAIDYSGNTIGFVVGTLHQSGLYTRLIMGHWLQFAQAALGATIKRPTIAPRLIRALAYPKISQDAASETLLMSIAVEPNAESLGIGKSLVNRFLTAATKSGARSVCLATDKDNNQKVNNFYSSIGFQLARSYTTPTGRTINEYVIDLNNWLIPRNQ